MSNTKTKSEKREEAHRAYAARSERIHSVAQLAYLPRLQDSQTVQDLLKNDFLFLIEHIANHPFQALDVTKLYYLLIYDKILL